jgi:serine/threonine-protein kinase
MLLNNNVEIKNRYVVEDLLGVGAFGEVYRVRHVYLGIKAMKVFKYAGVIRDELLKSMNEPIVLSEMKHPNIVGVYDADTFSRKDLSGDVQESGLMRDKQYGYYTMDYIPTTLEGYWKSFRNHLMPVSEVVNIIRQVCCGLAAAHRHTPTPILHRDIKPANILVKRSAGTICACISDFGLAKHVNPMAMAASLRGTMYFKPPEAMADHVDTPASDVWAVGVTLYMLLTDRLPFQVVGQPQRLLDHDRPVRNPSEYNASVPEELNRIALKALNPDPRRRYRDGQEMLDALLAWEPKAAISSAKDQIGTLPISETENQAANGDDISAVARSGVVAGTAAVERRLWEVLDLARSGSEELSQAADKLEGIIKEAPELAGRLANCLHLWRLGIYTPFAVKDLDKMSAKLGQTTQDMY